MGALHAAVTHAHTTEETKDRNGLLPNDMAETFRLSGFMKSWFALDALLALAPPLYWAADRRLDTIIGIPVALLYFIAVGFCITLSVVVADVGERLGGERAE